MAKAKIEISEVGSQVYKKIVTWHNGEDEEPNTQNLILLANEIVEFVLQEAFENGDITTDVGIEMGEKAQENMMKAFSKHQEKEAKENKKGIFDFMKKKG